MSKIKVKVLFVASEIAPYAKTGGLADVSSALPIALKEKGIDVISVMPLYSKVNREKYKLKKVMDSESLTNILTGPVFITTAAANMVIIHTGTHFSAVLQCSLQKI